MRAIAIGVLILIAWASDCWAYGSIARGYAGRSIRFVSVVDRSIKEDDQSAAISACLAQGLASCEVIFSFRDRCVSVAISQTGTYTTALGEDIEGARTIAITGCRRAQGNVCTEALTTCDETPTTEPSHPSYDFGFLADPRFRRLVHVSQVAAYGATAIVAALSLWLFATMLSTTEPDVLKRRAAIFGWIALPSLPICAAWAFLSGHPILGGALGLTLLCWTLVYAALWIGSLIQTDRQNAPDVLSLPLAAFLFSAITIGLFAAFIAYGIVPKPDDCEEEMKPLSLCGLSRLEGFYFSFGAIVILIFMGIFLSTETHLVRLYTRFWRSVSKIGSAPRHGWGPAVLSLRSALIAVSYAAAIFGGFVLAAFLDPLRLWKENRIGIFEIAAVGTVCVLAMAILFLLRKVHGLQQLLTASPLASRVVVDDPKTATDRTVNNRPRSTLTWDPGAIKETFKRKRNEFEV
jgi:Domain of unknown function (DUF4189)